MPTLSESRRGWWLLSAAVTLAVTASLTVPAAAAAPPACKVVLVSPAFRQDRTVVCVHRVGSSAPYIMAVSRDGGRTWRNSPMTGLARPPDYTGTALTIVLSPTFGTDTTVFATTASGTFMSTDRGETFTPLDALLVGGDTPDNPVAYLAVPPTTPLGSGDQKPVPHLAYAHGSTAAVVDVASRTHRLAFGVPGFGAVRFVVAKAPGKPDTLLALVNEPDASSAGSHLVVYRCDASVTCAERLFAFPNGAELGAWGWLRATPDGSLVAMLPTDDPHVPAVWRSTDGGRTFVTWQSVSQLVSQVNTQGGFAAAVTLAGTSATPRRLYLRIEKDRPPGGFSKNAPPASQVFRSDDSGASWRLVAYARPVTQPGPRGNAPWRTPGSADAVIQVAADGRVLAVGRSETLSTTFCSLDGGLHWTVGCQR